MKLKFVTFFKLLRSNLCKAKKEMMEKALVITIITLLLAASPTFAKDNNNNGNGNNGNGQGKKVEVTAEVDADASASPSPSASASAKPKGKSKNLQTECNPSLEWKNHGAYVSCVAKLKMGGQAVSEAARSDVGKKNKNPNASASASPSVSPSPSATASASPSASPEASASAALSFNAMGDQIMDWVSQIEDLIGKIKGFFARN